MKIYLIHSLKYDYQNELYKPLKESPLSKQHEIIFLFDITSNLGSTKEIIKNCDMVIAEVSYPSIGIGIELGWADAFNKPVVCVYKKGEKTSKFLSVLTDKIAEYSDSKELISKLSEMIEL